MSARLHSQQVRFGMGGAACASILIVVAGLLPVGTANAGAAAKVGGKCTKAGAKSAALVCTKKAGRLVWAKGAAAPAAAGIEGAWKPTADSVIGYRVEEKLQGEDVTAYGRTNAITGSMTIAGTTVSAVDLTVDVASLKSDQGKRDGQVRGRIMETDKYPTAKLVLKSPIALGSVPADKVEITQKATITLTVKATTKDVEIQVKARRNGPNIEINGVIPVVWTDWGIENPSLPAFGITTEDNGLLEFLVVFSR